MVSEEAWYISGMRSDGAVAGGAAHALGHVDAVVEIDVIRQAVDPLPADRLVARETLPHGREHLRVGPDLRMAGHAGLGRRKPA